MKLNIFVHQIIILSLTHLGTCNFNDYEFLLENCCNIGITRAKQLKNAECIIQNTYFDQFTTNSEYKTQCETVMKICCIKEHHKYNCEKGKSLASTTNDCSQLDKIVLTQVGNDSALECCLGCKLGMLAAKENFPCTFNAHGSFGLGNPWEDIYYECCNTAKNQNRNDNNAQLIKRKGARISLCDVEPFPCAHNCYDPGAEFGSVQCTCFKGYQLASDGRNCIDINECEDGTNDCDSLYEDCVNKPGDYQCIKKPLESTRQNSNDDSNQDKKVCRAGYKWNTTKQKCEDIDECVSNTDDCNRVTQICKNLLGSFTCLPKGKSCPPGFKQGPNGLNDCVDVDECAENLFDCQTPEERCVNSYGAYYCEPANEAIKQETKSNIKLKCPSGFRLSKTTLKCEDIDECLIGQHSCNLASHICLNANGSYICISRNSQINHLTCTNGFRKNRWSGECEDINECELNSNACPKGQTCQNTIGSYQCYCQVGYAKDAVTGQCKDINECQLNTHTCHHTLRCDNTIGSFHCVRVQDCGTGYTINAETDSCEDIDECILGTHNCGQDFRCRNTDGSFRCDRTSCPSNYQLLYDGTCRLIDCGSGKIFNKTLNSCADVDECLNSPCLPSERCVNTIGSYKCSATCSPGYKLSKFGNICQDIDECELGIDLCEKTQICKNKPGYYSCECPTGFSLNQNRQCEDIDECAKYGTSVCFSDISICKNTIGSYQCECKPGYKNDETGRLCVDVNECFEMPNLCSQKCFNTWGSFQCSCEKGYKLSDDKRTCVDIDECDSWSKQNKLSDYFLCIGICKNTPGSYECTCPNGYRLESDMKTCKDIDECEESNICKGENQVCLNTRGSYKCNRIECLPGYERDKTHRSRCKKKFLSSTCNNDAQCLAEELKEPLSYSYNYLTFVSNITIPSSGYLDLFTLRGPVLSVTTVQFDLKLISSTTTKYGLRVANKNDFHLRRTAYNEAMISLVRPIDGPQEVQLELEVKLYHGGLFGGTSKAILYIFVSEYEF